MDSAKVLKELEQIEAEHKNTLQRIYRLKEKLADNTTSSASAPRGLTTEQRTQLLNKRKRTAFRKQ
jgi:hypothetical protein